MTLMDIIDFVASCVRLISWLKTTLYQSSFIIYNKITFYVFFGQGQAGIYLKHTKKKNQLDLFLPGGRKKSGSGAPVSACIDACKAKNTKSTYMQYIKNTYTPTWIEYNSSKNGNSEDKHVINSCS